MQIMKRTGDMNFYSNDSHNWILFWEKKHPFVNRTISNHISIFKLGFQIFISESYILVTPEVESLQKCAKKCSMSIYVAALFLYNCRNQTWNRPIAWRGPLSYTHVLLFHTVTFPLYFPAPQPMVLCTFSHPSIWRKVFHFLRISY